MKRINYGNNSDVNTNSRMSRLNRDNQSPTTNEDQDPDYNNNDGYSERYNGVMPDAQSEPQSDQVVAREPIKKHHYVRDVLIGIAVVICLAIGMSWYNSHEEQQATSNQPQTTRINKTINNTTNNPAPHNSVNNHQAGEIEGLQHELNNMGMQQQQTQQLLNKFINVSNPNTQNEIYKHAQLVRYIPVQPIQRTIVEKVLG